MEGVIKLLLFGTALVLALPLIHPFGDVKETRSRAPLTGVHPLVERACKNCHSENTEWPVYSYFPFLSWAIEKDVAEARERMNFSQWDQYPADTRRDLLARIGTVVRNRQMPLPRYLMLHPEARLSDEEIKIIYDWTKNERRALRNSGSGE